MEWSLYEFNAQGFTQVGNGSEYYKADLRSVGPVSGWYFEEQSQCNGNASCICSAVDNEYGISKMAGYFGGLVSYGVANTDVYWGGKQSDKKLITPVFMMFRLNPKISRSAVTLSV